MSDHHDTCQVVKTLEREVQRMKGNTWKILTAVIVIVLGFSGCSSTIALAVISRSGDKLEYQRQLIDKNKEAIGQGESRYQRMEGTISALVDGMKEQREEQKKLLETVHRIEIMLVKKQTP